MLTTCPSCGAASLLPFYTQYGIPIHSCVLLPTRDAALAFPRGDLHLAWCDRCGFITNAAFDLSRLDYAQPYEDQQSFSPTFNRFARDLAAHLVTTYDLRDRHIVEIGCGKGDFLIALCELGNNRGTGIDPAARPERLPASLRDRLILLPELYGSHHADLPCDALICRHTLEHIPNVREFLSLVRYALGDRQPLVFFEVPDTTRILQTCAIEDIYYEHCSYFTVESLATLFRSCGFEVLSLRRAYGDLYLLLEARPTAIPPSRLPDRCDVPQEVQSFAARARASIAQWQQALAESESRVAIWGSGSKGVAFLTALAMPDRVAYAVDINPFRQGKFMPGVGLEIKSPEALRDDPPDRVVVMNAVYLEEIRTAIAALGLAPHLDTLPAIAMEEHIAPSSSPTINSLNTCYT